MKKLTNNQSGSTLVQAILALGIVSIGSLVFAEIMNNSFKAQSTVTAKTELNNFINLAVMVYQNATNCEVGILNNISSGLTFDASLINSATPPSLSISKLTYPDGSIFAEPGTKISNNLTVESISLVIDKELVAGLSYAGKVVIQTKLSGSFVGSPQLIRNFPITLTTNSETGSSEPDSTDSGVPSDSTASSGSTGSGFSDATTLSGSTDLGDGTVKTVEIVTANAGPTVPKYYTGSDCNTCPYGSYRSTSYDGNNNLRTSDTCYTIGEAGGPLLKDMNGSICHGKGINSDGVPYSEGSIYSFWSY